MPTYVTSNESKIHVTVAGVTFPAYIKTWATFEGGDPEAEQDQLMPGNVLGAVATPGPVKRSPVTVGIPLTVELHNLRSKIDTAVNNSMTASYTPTDADGNENGNTETRTGLLRKPAWPKWDPTSGKVENLTLTMTCDT